MPKTARLALKFPLGFLDSPASCYALFTALRGNVAAAHWCASQFHQRLLREARRNWRCEVPLLGQEEEEDEEVNNGATNGANASPVLISQLVQGWQRLCIPWCTKDGSGLRRAKSAYDFEGDALGSSEQEVVRRILRAPDVFSVLGIQEKGPEALAEVKTAYKKHPDKVRSCDPDEAKATFARLDAAAKDALSEVQKGVDACATAAETLQILRCGGAAPASVPVASLSALGLRDLRSIGARLQVRCAAYRAGDEVRIALCSGATAQLPMKDLEDVGAPEGKAIR
eukprot:Skav232769  [mRNA]  locus=scaffold1229:260207:265699:- [translate_table: standard]